MYATLHWNGVPRGTNDYAALLHREAIEIDDRTERHEAVGESRALYDEAWANGSTAAIYNVAMRFHGRRRNAERYEAGKSSLARAAAAAPPEVRRHVELAYATHLSWMIKHPDYGERQRRLRELAEGGMPEAQIVLADMLRGEDDAGALRYARMSAGSGRFEGVSLYAYLRWNRAEADHETAETIAWIKRAADMGNLNAQARLGKGYQHGYYGLEQDHERAIYWLERAMSGNYRGEPPYVLARATDGLRFPMPRLPWSSDVNTTEAAALALARYYADGKHVPTDLDRARTLALHAENSYEREAKKLISQIGAKAGVRSEDAQRSTTVR